MPNIGPLEIAVVLIIVLIIFGPKRLPELGQSMGRGIREFKGSLSGDKDKDDPAEQRRELEATREAAAQRPQPAEGATPAEGAQPAEPVEGEVVTENKA
jgi:sec-independent protein translocase protein TatA